VFAGGWAEACEGAPPPPAGSREGDLMLDEWKLDVENARFVTERTVVRGGNTRRTHFVVRWFSVPELRAWLEDAGFENVRAPGVTKDSRLIVVAERA
jgi:hypothetical protein